MQGLDPGKRRCASLLPVCYRAVAVLLPVGRMIATDVGHQQPHRASRGAGRLRQERVMGQAIPRQHPAVVLRSHFNQLRALLAITMVAVLGLTAAVVILATNDDQAASPATVVSVPAPNGDIRYDGGPEEGTAGVSTSQGLAREAGPAQNDGLRYDGGPEEGTAGVVPARQPTVTPETQIKDEAKIAAAVGQARSGIELRGSKASDGGTSQYRLPADSTSGTTKDYSKNAATGDNSSASAQPTGSRYDGGPDEGTALSGARP